MVLLLLQLVSLLYYYGFVMVLLWLNPDINANIQGRKTGLYAC